jgi:hypothetical protein
MSTLLITNNLNVYKNVYKFLKASTPLIVNDLSVYINVKVIFENMAAIRKGEKQVEI